MGFGVGIGVGVGIASGVNLGVAVGVGIASGVDVNLGVGVGTDFLGTSLVLGLEAKVFLSLCLRIAAKFIPPEF